MDGRLLDKVVAWKFELEIDLPDGRVFPRISYVKLPDRHAAAKALRHEYPMARFAIEQGQPLTKEALDNDMAGDSFLYGEVVRCVFAEPRDRWAGWLSSSVS